MIELLLAIVANVEAKYEPPPAVFYPQAIGCGATTFIAKSKEPAGDEFGQLMTWGMIIADMGKKAGRTAAQVESETEAAVGFFRKLKEMKPPAFAAHLAYCRAVLDADRP